MSWRHRGPMESATSWTRHNLVACRCWQASAWQTNAMQEVATFLLPQRKFANLGAHGTTEYIAAGDSQAAVPFPTEIGRDFDLQWKTTSGLSYLLLQLVVTAGKRAFQRRALRRPHPARREVTCGDTDMDWPRLGAVLHTTGLWGRSYLGVGRRCILTVEEYTYGITQRGIRPYGHLAQYRGWPETRAS